MIPVLLDVEIVYEYEINPDNFSYSNTINYSIRKMGTTTCC